MELSFKWAKRLAATTALIVVGSLGLPASGSTIGGVNLGDLTDYLFVFTNGSQDLNWQSASKGYVGDVAANGTPLTGPTAGANFRTSGLVPYAGTIYTNATSLESWQDIVDDNTAGAPGVTTTQAFGSTGQVARLAGLTTNLTSAFTQINALPATVGYTSKLSTDLDGLDTTNGINETFVINITSGLSVSTAIDITGDAGDAFILRWDSDTGTAGYQGQAKFQSGGAIVPHGGLTPANFVNVAGDIASSGGGSNPAAPYPQGPRIGGNLIENGADWAGGGFFTGYWLTTGSPTNGDTSSLSNAIFVGGWYSSSDKIDMTSGTSGVHITPPNGGGGPGVPEPSTASLLFAGIGTMLARRSKRPQRNS